MRVDAAEPEKEEIHVREDPVAEPEIWLQSI